MAELIPYPFDALVRRMFRELDEHDAIFELPRRKFFRGAPGKDFSVGIHGRRTASPLGPAAGPHTQMAQNLVLAWLGGARFFELKTVQVRDDLTIPRPCIDMQTIGFNAEWSQELKLEQSCEEYVKGAMLIRMLEAAEGVSPAPGFENTLYDMSVGYDLAGIRDDRVTGFMNGMLNARESVDRLRKAVPPEFRALRDLDFPSRISDTLTLSTFHGCPPDEIERMVTFLMREFGLHCIVKFNPMLLGRDETRALLNDTLGYTDIRIPDRAFEQDATWEQAIEIVERLERTAGSLGVGFGVKFSNTLIVETHRGFIPPSEKEVYLSGAPLHVLALHLVRRFRRHFGDRIPISFSAGIDRANVADAVAIGLAPITACSDLLKVGGYARLGGYHTDLARNMDRVGASTIDDFILRAYGLGEDALGRLGLAADDPVRARCMSALADGSDLRAAAGEWHERWVSEARQLNTEHYVGGVAEDPRYSRARNSRPPKKIGRRLELFDCVTCDICLPVCPNAANFRIGSGEGRVACSEIRRDGSGWRWCPLPDLELAERHQIGTYADFCNDCGNCDVFCPEDGGPYRLKPHVFGTEAGWRAHPERDGFYFSRTNGCDLALGRFEGEEVRLEIDGGAIVYAGKEFDVRFREADPEGTLQVRGPDTIDLTRYAILDHLRRMILNPADVNYVNCR
jgi:putative selenate reductase